MRNSFLSVEIHCARRLWVGLSCAGFVLLGVWPCFDLKGENASLFGLVWAARGVMPGDLQAHPWDVALGYLLLSGCVVGYALISTTVGWLLAAIVGAITALHRRHCGLL